MAVTICLTVRMFMLPPPILFLGEHTKLYPKDDNDISSYKINIFQLITTRIFIHKTCEVPPQCENRKLHSFALTLELCMPGNAVFKCVTLMYATTQSSLKILIIFKLVYINQKSGCNCLYVTKTWSGFITSLESTSYLIN